MSIKRMIDHLRRYTHIHKWDYHADRRTDEVEHRTCRNCPVHEATSVLRTDWTTVFDNETCQFWILK